MMASLAKSITLASLFVSPSSRAFTTLSTPWPSGHLSISKSLLFYEPKGDSDNKASSSSSPSSSQSQQDRPSLVSSQSPRDERHGSDALGNDVPDLQLPSTLPPPDHVEEVGPRSSEFNSLESRPVGSLRRSRLEAEARASAVYVPGSSDAHWDLQDEIRQLEAELAVALGDDVGGNVGGAAAVAGADVEALRGRLRRARARDPAYVHRVVGGASLVAAGKGHQDQSERYREESMRARRMLPQFNLEGLWVGRYGDGFDMINVTYSGDELIAYKVTGDQNVPRGEVSFTSNLSPHRNSDDMLDPIVLSESAAEKWGVTRLPRFPGRGHAAESGFRNSHFLEGQLVVIGAAGDYFSFAWVPLEHQIFFGRPSPELALRMLREGGAPGLTAGTGREAPGPDAGRRERTEYATRCLEATTDALFDEASEGKADPFSCIWHGDDEGHVYFE